MYDSDHSYVDPNSSDFSSLSRGDLTFNAVAEEFVRLHRLGKKPSVEDFVRKYPHLAEDIKSQFQYLLLLETHAQEARFDNFQLPIKLDRYLLNEKIGVGGMGVVYRAYQANLERDVAIKVMTRLNVRNDENRIEWFKREARAASVLHHPNIVPVFDYGFIDPFAYLSMNFIDGLSLERFIKRFSPDRPFRFAPFEALRNDWSLVAKFGADVCSALDYAHGNGTIHRDIKPANLMLDVDGKCWVTDFGLAKFADDEPNVDENGDIIGTPRYMSPEQFKGRADQRSDVYGLGITLFEIAARKKVWNAVHGGQLVHARSCLELPYVKSLNKDVPEELADIIKKACSLDPNERFQTAAEFRRALNQFAFAPINRNRRSRDTYLSDEEYLPAKRSKALPLLMSLVIAGLAVFGVKNMLENPGRFAKSVEAPAVVSTIKPTPAAPKVAYQQVVQFQNVEKAEFLGFGKSGIQTFAKPDPARTNCIVNTYQSGEISFRRFTEPDKDVLIHENNYRGNGVHRLYSFESLNGNVLIRSQNGGKNLDSDRDQVVDLSKLKQPDQQWRWKVIAGTVPRTWQPVHALKIGPHEYLMPPGELHVEHIFEFQTDVLASATEFEISGGADANQFTVDASTGRLSFLVPPRPQYPTDSDKNSVYEVQVVQNKAGKSLTHNLRITVVNM